MKSAIPLLVLLTLAGCAGAQISTDYDAAADFSGYRTYAWIRGTEAANPVVEQRIKNAVDRNLAARGLTKVKESPDLQVATHASTSVQQQVDVQSFGYGYAGLGWGGNTVNVYNVDVGTLLLDIVDASSEQLVWRGMATGVVGHQVTQEKVDGMVGKMLNRYPPGNG